MDAGSAAVDDYYYASPEEKAEHVACAEGCLGRLPPSYLLKDADDYGYIPELLELEQAAYLAPYYDLFTEIKRLIRIDDKDQFASFLRANHDLVQKYPPEGVLQLLCEHSAVACATALLESRPNDLDLDSAHYGPFSPLEKAARNLSHGMTKLLLEHGADADIDCGAGSTPLHLALDAFMKCIKGWTRKDSILKLFSLFALPELKEPLDIIRMLASYSRGVEDHCISAMNVGCVEDYTALLMVAWDKLMVSSDAEGGLETTPVGQHIFRVLSNASLQQEICERYLYRFSREELVKNLTIALYVVNTMWMPIRLLERYCLSRVESLPMWELLFHITCDLGKDSGLDLKLGDANIQCSLPKLTSEATVLPERKYYLEPRQSGPILRSFLGKHMTGTSGLPHFQYRTLHVHNPIENRLCKTRQVKPSSHNVLALAKVCAPLLSFAKRSIK